MQHKSLIFAVSVSMPKNEAYCFAKSMNGDDKFYIYKTKENLKARDAQRRESWIVTRFPRKGEIVKGTFALWAEKGELVPVN
jgi:hypothetical protein